MLKLKVGDTIKVIQGKDKGRTGKIEKIFPKQKTVLIPGINIYKKHVKKATAVDKKGGIYEIPRPLQFSKVALVCPKCKKLTRIGFKHEKDKSGEEIKKVRVCRKCKKSFS